MPAPGHVTVIIPARNAAQTVGAAVSALRSGSRIPDAIVVVDDGSRDSTGEVARGAGGEVLSVVASGPALARAAGARAAPPAPDPQSAVLVFTDADCVAQREFLERLVEPILSGQADVAKGAYLTDQRGLVPRFVQLEFEERYRRLAGRDTTDFADGHAAAYRRSVFEAAGGFDTRLRLSQNVDLAYRLAEEGKRIVFVPDAQLLHRHPSSVWAYAKAKTQRSYWRAQSLCVHPGKAVSDSYTPASLKLQMASLLLAIGLVKLDFLHAVPPVAARTAAAACLAVFVASTIPFHAAAWRDDRPVAYVALPLLIVRAGALTVGTLAGLVVGAFGRKSDQAARPSASLDVAQQ